MSLRHLGDVLLWRSCRPLCKFTLVTTGYKRMNTGCVIEVLHHLGSEKNKTSQRESDILWEVIFYFILKRIDKGNAIKRQTAFSVHFSVFANVNAYVCFFGANSSQCTFKNTCIGKVVLFAWVHSSQRNPKRTRIPIKGLGNLWNPDRENAEVWPHKIML